MKFKELFENWGLKGLKINVGVAEMEWSPATEDSDAAWDLYVELLTRITTQPLPDDAGIEATALASIHSLFGLTRETLKHHGRKAEKFTKIAIIVLNQVIRPFTAKWHKLSTENAFQNADQCAEFRTELKELQSKLICYTRILADVAEVEDLTTLEEI